MTTRRTIVALLAPAVAAFSLLGLTGVRSFAASTQADGETCSPNEVEVDLDLATVKVLHIVAAHDVGRAVNPTLVEGQIHGGIAQGLGLALMEEFIPGRTENLHDYLIPTVGDVPPITVKLIEDPEPEGRSAPRASANPRWSRPRRRSSAPSATPPASRCGMFRRCRTVCGSCFKPGGRHMTARLSTEHRSQAVRRRGRRGIVRCDACPILCRIRPGRAGACSRYANDNGQLVRTDPVLLLDRAVEQGRPLVPFAAREWDGQMLEPGRTFVTGVGAGTTYPDYKPAPLIISSEHDGVDTVTVVTEGIFSYCGLKVKIDTDRHLGPEVAAIRVEGEQVGHVTTAEYGSQMFSIGGVRHLTGGSKKEGTVTCDTMLKLCAGDGGGDDDRRRPHVVVQAGHAPIVDGKPEQRMRVGCGSATVGIFAKQWLGHVDEVVVVDDHITGVLTEHQAGKVLGMPPSGVRVSGRRRRRAATSRSPIRDLGGAAPTSPIRSPSSGRSIRRSRGRACGC